MIGESQMFALYGRTVKEAIELASSVRKANGKKLKDEKAIVSLADTIIINNSKAKSQLDGIAFLYKKGAPSEPKDRQVAYNIFKGIYADLIAREPQTQSVLEEWVIKRGLTDFKDINDRMIDYLARNDYSYNLIINHDLRKVVKHIDTGDDDEEEQDGKDDEVGQIQLD